MRTGSFLSVLSNLSIFTVHSLGDFEMHSYLKLWSQSKFISKYSIVCHKYQYFTLILRCLWYCYNYFFGRVSRIAKYSITEAYSYERLHLASRFYYPFFFAYKICSRLLYIELRNIVFKKIQDDQRRLTLSSFDVIYFTSYQNIDHCHGLHELQGRLIYKLNF